MSVKYFKATSEIVVKVIGYKDDEMSEEDVKDWVVDVCDLETGTFVVEEIPANAKPDETINARDYWTDY